jgi:hypothetical protein
VAPRGRPERATLEGASQSPVTYAGRGLVKPDSEEYS